MKKGWRIVLTIVIICFALGAVSAAVGLMTGADFDRIGSGIEDWAAEKYNVDARLFFQEWLPQSMKVIREDLTH